MKKLLKLRSLRLLVISVTLWCVFFYGFKFYEVEGDSMDPTLKDERLILANKVFYRIAGLERGDVVLISTSLENLVKRVVGLSGEKIQIVDGYIFVNDVLIDDKFKNKRISILLVDEHEKPLRNWETGELIYEYVTEKPIFLKKGQIFVIGDNRELSWYGVINKENIIGKVMFQ